MQETPEQKASFETPNRLTFNELPPRFCPVGDSGARHEQVAEPQADEPRSWYAVVVRHNNERSAVRKLELAGVVTFVPMRTVVRREGRRRITSETPVIHTVVFARLTEQEAVTLDRYSFVTKVLRAPGSRRPTPIPDAEIDTLKFMLLRYDGQLDIQPLALGAGQDVAVVRGPLQGLHGRVVRPADPHGRVTIAVPLTLLGAATLSIPLSYLRKA